MSEKFRFYNGAYECCDRPSIARDDPDGGDPHTLGIFRRINNPEDLYELCALANERIDQADLTKTEGVAIIKSIEELVPIPDTAEAAALRSCMLGVFKGALANLTQPAAPQPVSNPDELDRDEALAALERLMDQAYGCGGMTEQELVDDERVLRTFIQGVK